MNVFSLSEAGHRSGRRLAASPWLDADPLLLRQIHVVHDHDKPLAARARHDEIQQPLS
jgi:hypothetical protein